MPPPDPSPTAVDAGAIAAQVPRLRRYAAALVGNLPDADDLVQDCVEKALANRHALRDGSRLGGWLLSILHNLHVSGLRWRKRRGAEVPVEDLADDLALSAAPADRGEVRDFVRAFGQLSEEHRSILLLTGMEGLSYREAAEVLEVPVGTVMSRLARARERLRVLLDGGEETVVRRIK
ncbi:sigma-70 family RNA polymerase sigma factor [Azospirillum rugosum]|uniref:RNA polymerase sigma-70 factor (ECF subfamily) n=1 Tax=Azospirillum rugosum TaxID=416170 RepID=A0ABS4SLY8_9PROT|nr:sigma-70 family RNA polymerase sigma factor [Azospirillum rugosum]MBP2293540.1 RNA polymerase sigma-70 factor (ECF subfamily) [Azospirillum rugosum]MDQ0529219.1 RNA polymerase sigma-70 factor (ECF subfamily) [Azospirillum rugosum]